MAPVVPQRSYPELWDHADILKSSDHHESFPFALRSLRIVQPPKSTFQPRWTFSLPKFGSLIFPCDVFSSCKIASDLIGVFFQTFDDKIFLGTWSEARDLAVKLVSNMTLGDKIEVLKGQGILSGTVHDRNHASYDAGATDTLRAIYFQHAGPCVGTTTAITEGGRFPAICMQDGPAGLREVDEFVTAFPAGISVAATWDRKLMRARGVALGEEWRAKGSHVFLGPAVDLTRAQEGGRAWESFGADAFLNGEAAYETIVGVQSQGVQACVKHLIGNNQEQYRFSMTSKIDGKTLRELYFKPFQRAIDAEVACVMCSYNKFNDNWSCKNPELLGEDGLLRKEGGFQGYVVSDWGASHGTAVKSVKESVSAGLDVEMPGGYIFVGGGVYSNLKAAVEAKYVPESDVNKMATRFISAWFKLEQDKAYPPISFDAHDKSRQTKLNVRSEAHTQLVRKIAAASAILLKNFNGELPLSPPATLALIGVDAASIPKKKCGLNDYERHGTISVGWGSGSNCLQNVVAPAVAIQDMLTAEKASTKVHTSLTNDINSAVAAAKAADVAIVFVYTFSGEIGAGFTRVEGNLGDRKDLNLLQNGEELIKTVSAVNNKTIVVIHSVGSVVVETWVDLPGVKAIIMAGLPGEQTGPGIADVLFGKVNPSGRLPYTIAKNEDDFGVKVYSEGLFNGLEPLVDYKEGLLTDYRRFNQLNITARYCFGHGLSYTTFRYSQLTIGRGQDDVAYEVSFQVTNDGPRDGTEVAQLYLTFPSGLREPPKQLRGFDAVFIPRGGTQTISLALKTPDISVYDTNLNKWITPDRGFNVYVGSSLLDIHLEGSI